MKKSDMQFNRRKARNRFAIRTNSDRVRLSVSRSNLHIEAQIIDDKLGKTLVSASSKEKDFAEKGSTVAGATKVGQLVAERAVKAGIKEVVFDRGGYIYHGRVKALAEAARANGLDF